MPPVCSPISETFATVYPRYIVTVFEHVVVECES
jgi:hypothetical protein